MNTPTDIHSDQQSDTRPDPHTPAPAEHTSVPHGTTHPWRIVATREIVTRITDKAFILGTAITLLLMAAFFGWQIYSEGRTHTYTVAVTAQDKATGDLLAREVPKTDDGLKVTLDEVADEAAGRAAVRAGDADVLLSPTDTGYRIVALDEVPNGLIAASQTVITEEVLARNAAQAGTTPEQLLAGSHVSSSLLQGNAEQQNFAQAAGFVMAFLFYLTALGFGFTLAGSVVEEKQSRIVEIIASKIPIRQLLYGKVLGNAVMALAQTVLVAAVGLIGVSMTKYSTYLPGASAGLAWFIAFFVVGFLLIACWWAVAGALASRSEDLQSTASPLTFLMMGVFFAAFLFSGTALTVASFVPPFSIVLMPIRLLSGGIGWWEPLLALALLLLAAAATVRFAERIYRRALLQTQGRVSLKAVWGAED